MKTLNGCLMYNYRNRHQKTKNQISRHVFFSFLGTTKIEIIFLYSRKKMYTKIMSRLLY